MSLIGSLEDLSLGDILQIISLSQKSGTLHLRTRDGDGRIVFVDGLVRGAQLKDGPEDFRSVLVGGQFVTDAEFDDATRRAESGGQGIEKVIAEQTGLSQERIDSLVREAVEATVVQMFSWKVGEFSFDIQSETDPIELPLTLPMGINAQYLAMEGLRVRDESGRPTDDAEAVETSGDEELSAHEMFGVAPPDEDADPGVGESPRAAEAADVVALSTAVQVDAEPLASGIDEAEIVAMPETEENAGVETLAEAEAVGILDADEVLEADVPAALEVTEAPEADGPVEAPEVSEALEAPLRTEHEKAAQASEEAAAAAPAAPAALPPIVVIDPELAALEWAKRSLGECFPRVHIFQNSDLGLGRIRQYLARAEVPAVVLSPELVVDRLGGISDVGDFVRRLKSQARGMQILWLGEGEPEGCAADGRLARPSTSMFNDPRRSEALAELGVEMARVLVDGLTASPASCGGDAALSSGELGRLKEATALVGDASRRGEVLPLVIRFAGEIFSRVAMFMVREDNILGMAQIGMAAPAGPGDAGLRDISMKADACGWFREVLSRRTPLRAAPRDEGDRNLASLLGDRVPSQAYLAPIESGGQVIALLYADNLPGDEPIGETGALEVVLHHAGLAIDRAALERALTELVEEESAAS